MSTQKHRLFPLLLTILFIVSRFSFAANLTIDECIEKAMQNNPDIRKAQKNLDAAAAKRYQAFTFFLPNVSVSALYTHLDQNPPKIDISSFASPVLSSFQISGNPLLQYAFQDNYTANIRINQSLFSGGKNFRTFKAADAEYNAKKAELEITKDRIKVELIKSFYGVIIARAMKGLAEEATRQLEHHLKIVENFLNSGLATEYDYLKTEVQLLSWSPKVTRADRDLNNTMRHLKLLIGLEVDAQIEVGGEWELKYEPYKYDISIDQAKDMATNNRPEIMLVKAMKRAGSEINGVKLSPLFPQLALQYNYNLFNQKENFNLNRDSWKGWWDVRLNLTWEVFSFGRTISEFKENKYRVSGYDIELKFLLDKILAEVEDVFDYKFESQKAVELWKKNIELANRGYEIASEKYNNGKITNIDVLDSQVALIDARVQYLKSLYDYKVANAEFERIIGIKK